MRTNSEMMAMLVITGITNFCMFPAIINVYRQKMPFEACVGFFTMATSFLYHVCDSIDGPLWLSEMQWHKLDNIGAIMCFICWSIYLMDIQNQDTKRYMQYIFLAWVMIAQEKDPWDELISAPPLVVSFLILFVRYWRYGRPRLDYSNFRRGLLLLCCALLCFIKGLDDDNDPLRFFHGCWHGFVGAAAYYNFNVIPRKKASKEYLPVHTV